MYRKYTLFIILLFFTGCNKTVCVVGDINISEKDVEFRAKVSEVYYPQSGKQYIALAQLIKGYLSLQVLKSLGYEVNQSTLEEEARRIDKNTKAPVFLKKIKDIYGRDRNNYLKTFVTVVYAERILYNEIFLKSKEIPKRNYDEWFWDMASKIPVKTYNQSLKGELLKKISWAKNLRLE